MNGSFVALVSVQLNISPSGVKQQKTLWSVSQERQNSFYTRTKETNSPSLVCEVL